MWQKRNNRTTLILVLFLLGNGLASYASEFKFSGDQVATSLARGRERTLLKGNAVIRSDQTQISAAQIEIYGQDFRFARASGGVSVWDSAKRILITSESLTYDRREKIIVAAGNVYMEDQKNEIIIRGERLEHRDREDISIVQIGVRILKKDLSARAGHVRYKRDEEILELSGLPQVFWKRDHYKAARIIMNLRTDEITLIGDVSGAIVSESERD